MLCGELRAGLWPAGGWVACTLPAIQPQPPALVPITIKPSSLADVRPSARNRFGEADVSRYAMPASDVVPTAQLEPELVKVTL